MGLRLLKITGMEGHTHARTYTYTHAQSWAGIPPKSQPSAISRGVRELLSTSSVPVSGLGVSPSHQDFIKRQLYAPPYQEEEKTSKEKLL